MKTYHQKNSSFLSILLINSFLITMAIVIYRRGEIFFPLCALLSAGGSIFLFISGHYTEVIIADEKIIKINRKVKSYYELKWIRVDRIIEDIPFKWFRWMYVFHLIPKKEFNNKNGRWFSIANDYKNYTELLKDIIYRVSSNTPVDKFILEITGLSKEDIGKLYSDKEDKV